MEPQSPSPTPTPSPQVHSPKPSSPRGRGFLAVTATLFLPGLGHALAGRARRGVFWFCTWITVTAASWVSAGLPALVPALILLVPLAFLFAIWLWIDAYRTGRRAAAPMLVRPWRRYVAGLSFILAAAFIGPLGLVTDLARNHWVRAFSISARTMTPTLNHGDRILVNRRFPVRRWDIVAYRNPADTEQTLAHRIAALPGETVEIIDEELHINGQRMPRPHGLGPVANAPDLKPDNAAQGRPITLGSDEYFVLGDNSLNSFDSRYWRDPAPGRRPGTLPGDHILGPAITIYWPPSRWKRLR